MVTSTETVNRTFYDRLYGTSSLLSVLLKFYVSYDQLSKTRRNVWLARLIPEFSKPLSILDYGFGHGTFLLRLPKRHRLAGVELSEAALTNARKLAGLLGRTITLLSPDRFETASELVFDVISCSHVLEHVPDDIALLRQFHAHLRPGGYLLLNLPINEVWTDPNHVRTYTAATARSTLEATGFHVETITEADTLTAWLLPRDVHASGATKHALRIVRGALALLPARAVDALESKLLEGYEPQQLLILARKV